MPSATQLVAALAPHGLLEAATWTPAGGAATVVNGLFRTPALEAVDIEGVGPTFEAAAADMPAVARGDALVVGATTYKVATPKPDGVGFVVLTLQEQ